MKIDCYWQPLPPLKFKKNFSVLFVDDVVYLPIGYYKTLIRNNDDYWNKYSENSFDNLCEYIKNNAKEVATALNRGYSHSRDMKWNEENVLIALERMIKTVEYNRED